MSDTFSLGGDPASIRASAGLWLTFSTAAGTSSSDIRGMDSSEFAGDEAETFRGKVNDDLPPHLDTTSEAWNIVSTALTSYATKLEGFQSRLATLKVQHDNQQQTVQNAKSNLDSAKSADSAEQNRVTQATSKLKPGETLPASTYLSSTGGAQSSYTEAQSDLQATVDAANKIRGEHATAVRDCCNEINRAKDMRFEKPPGFWGRLKNSVVGWIADHADILKKISGVLKIISAIAGVLSFIPGLNVIMGPLALITGGAALLIDVGVKLATGEGSWLGIGIDALTMVLPGAGKLVGKGLKGAVGAERVAATTSRVKNAVNGSKAVTAIKASRGYQGLIKANDTVYAAVNKVPGLGALNARASAKAIERVRANGRPVDTAQAIANRHPDIVARTKANEPIVKRPAPRVPTKRTVAAMNKRTSTNDYICPESGRVSPAQRSGLPVTNPRHPDAMSIGHKEGSDYSASQVIHTHDGSTRQQVLDDYNNPEHYHGYENAKHNSSKASDSHLDNYTNNRVPVWDTTSPLHAGGGLVRLGNDS
jgi:hypothetical protein